MRSVFLCAVSVFISTCAFGGEDMPSVLKHDTAPAQINSAEVAAPVAAVTSSPCNNCTTKAAPQLICVNGRCGEQKLYSVDARENEHSRNRLFGGKVIRRYSRTVVRPVR